MAVSQQYVVRCISSLYLPCACIAMRQPKVLGVRRCNIDEHPPYCNVMLFCRSGIQRTRGTRITTDETKATTPTASSSYTPSFPRYSSSFPKNVKLTIRIEDAHSCFLHLSFILFFLFFPKGLRRTRGEGKNHKAIDYLNQPSKPLVFGVLLLPLLLLPMLYR